MNAARRDNDPLPASEADRPAKAAVAKPADKPVKRSSGDDATVWRRAAYALLITLSIGGVVGRILAVDSVDKFALEESLYRQQRPNWQITRPFLSANDRSRWDTVRSLVELGTYEIDQIIAEQGWDTIDMVQHVGDDGQLHLYSSKPPLMATLMAVPYWMLHKLTGWTLGNHPYELGRTLLLFYNVPLLVIYFLVLASLAERFGATMWGRLLMMATATGATLLTTFAVSITNHLPAAVATVVAFWAATRIVLDGERRWWWFLLAGMAGGFAFAFELPALSLLALIAAALAWRAPKLTLAAFLPAALLVVLAQYGTNYVAHGSLREPYAHRSETDPNDNWYKFVYTVNGRQRQSYWSDPVGVDRGEPSKGWYAFHSLIGHHGILSLTPIWLLSIAGFGFWIRLRDRWAIALSIAGLTLVCLGFYLFLRPQVDRNYGGMSSGLRWMFWFIPLWLILLLPAADWLAARRWGRGLALALLGCSVISVSYPTWNPWQPPWISNAVDHWHLMTAPDAEPAAAQPQPPTQPQPARGPGAFPSGPGAGARSTGASSDRARYP